jgi:TetR/AcrR family transcriptional regulator
VTRLTQCDSSTLQKIITEGKQEFLQKGFKDASLRNIVKRAGVTTGAFYGYYPDKSALFEALVKPVADGIINMFSEMEAEFLDGLDASVETGSYRMDGFSIRRYISYIYDHYDAFKLLITRAEGTPYSEFKDMLVEMDVISFYRYFDWLEQAGIPFKRPDRNLIHILTNAQYSAIFEIVVHDMSREAAFTYADTIVEFFINGWNIIFKQE